MKPPLKQLFKNALIIYLSIFLYALLPLIATLIAGWITGLSGVGLNEGYPPDIKIWGVHAPVIGNILYFIGNMAWIAILTIPLAAILLLAYTVYLVYIFVKISRSPT